LLRLINGFLCFGLDDLIVGAYGADPSGKSYAGKSYVVFGKANSSAINLSAIADGLRFIAISICISNGSHSGAEL
jgi:hypothetical protein